ncbi:GGDEF domain-containing protein [Desulfosarcina widdelii]|uniref:diguanylate cyclase n=1 Tax=Desulfosarcina widdelii TaxID=947919 RepID=A0A5K7Z0C1_9BACT|nr:GGDEF domain-containing protein [Desulfosarcina widdelii]BBO74338.1 GGDEF domain-containing protein [Desulfosarcina widdelii]
MLYSDSVEDSRLYFRLALEEIGKFGLPIDPLNYCIWYEYFSERNSDLNRFIDNYLKQNGTFSSEVSRKLFNQFILNGKEPLNELVQNELKKVFSNLFRSIETTHQTFAESGNNLDAMSQTLDAGITEPEINAVVEQIKKEIKKLESSSGNFQEDIQHANREIETLKEKVARYKNEATKDPLTKLDNRRSFDKKMKAALDEANREKSSLCLVIADIDYFKKINDTHGHLVGDNVLRMVASTMKESINGNDTLARIGGEEFAILLPRTPLDGAVKLADDIRASFEKLDLKKKSTGESLGTITMSFGVTTYKHSEDADEFIHRADQALYQSKESGRNRVTGQ